MDKEILDKICIICGLTGTKGITIMDKKICTHCEEKAVEAEITSEFYEFYKDKITKNISWKVRKQS